MKAQRDLALNKGLSKEISASTKTVIMSKTIAFVLVSLMGFCIFGCTSSSFNEAPPTDTPDKPQGSTTQIDFPAEPAPTNNVMTTDQADTLADFSLRLFGATYDDDNTLISPLSVAYALNMVELGAQGQTLSQIEDATGMTSEEMNGALTTLSTSFTQRLGASDNDDSESLYIANALWVDQRFPINPDYLATTESQLNAEVFSGMFGDQTVSEVNTWVNSHTNGMIPHVLDKLLPFSALVLVNAASFDAQWDSAYEDDDLVEDVFTNASGQTQKVTFMESEEDYYIELTNACGFMKFYDDTSFAFVGLLPAEGSTPGDVIEGLTGENLRQALAYSRYANVSVRLPRFSDECRTNLVDPLTQLGITDAFGDYANFSGMIDDAPSDNNDVIAGDEGFYISSAMQDAVIEVDENGTRAAAATVIVGDTAAPAAPPEDHEVYLDRPFVYMIVHVPTNLPVFIGTVNTLNA